MSIKMRPNFSKNSFLSLFFFCYNAFAGAGFIFVTNHKDKSCSKYAYQREDKDSGYYFLGTSEVTEILSDYFAHKKNKKNYDAIINRAGLKFCSDFEEDEIFRYFWKVLETPKPDRRVFEVVGNYASSARAIKEIRPQIEAHDNSEIPRRNLRFLKAFSNLKQSKD